MLRIFRVDTSNAYISVSIFAQQGPFSQVRSQIIKRGRGGPPGGSGVGHYSTNSSQAMSD